MLFHSSTLPRSLVFIHVFKSPGTLMAHYIGFKSRCLTVLLSALSSFLVLIRQRPHQRYPFLCCYGNCVGISIKHDNRSKCKNGKERFVRQKDKCVFKHLCVCIGEKVVCERWRVRKEKVKESGGRKRSTACSGFCVSAVYVQTLKHD